MFASFRGHVGLVKILVENTPLERQKELIDYQRNVFCCLLLVDIEAGADLRIFYKNGG